MLLDLLTFFSKIKMYLPWLILAGPTNLSLPTPVNDQPCSLPLIFFWHCFSDLTNILMAGKRRNS